MSSVTCSLPCNTSIRLIPQTYLKLTMWAANTINLSRLRSQSESFMSMLSLWWATAHVENLNEMCLNALIWVVSPSKQACIHALAQCSHATWWTSKEALERFVLDFSWWLYFSSKLLSWYSISIFCADKFKLSIIKLTIQTNGWNHVIHFHSVTNWSM